MTAKLLEGYMHFVSLVVAAGEPPVSPYWIDGQREFYLDGYRERVEMVGRAGAKTRNIVLEGITETLLSSCVVPANERHYFCHVAENMTEAQKTLRIYQAYLATLGVPFDATADCIELRGMNRGIRVLPGRIGAVKGFRAIGWRADEAAAWADGDGANPAREIIANLRAMTVTHPEALGGMYSSPLGKKGFFYDTHTMGTSPRTLCRHAPSWIANESISEQQTHELEPDPKVWAREYGGVPQDAISAVFDGDAVARAFRKRDRRGYAKAQGIGLADISSGKKDATTWGVGRYNVADLSDQFVKNADGSIHMPPWGDPIQNPHWTKPDVVPFLEVDFVDGVDGGFWSTLSSDAIDDRIAAAIRSAGARSVHADQRESFHFRTAMNTRRLVFVEHPWTATSKPKAVELVRRWLRDDVIALPDHAELRAQLLAFEEKITPSGAITFGARGRTHDDYVALLVTLAHAELAGMVPSSPQRKKAPPRGVVATNPGFPF